MANERTCDGNCLRCSFQQQNYCAAQRTYQLMKNEEVLFAHLKEIEEELTALSAAVKKFEGSEPIINPLQKIEGKAQDGGGAENRSPEE